MSTTAPETLQTTVESPIGELRLLGREDPATGLTLSAVHIEADRPPRAPLARGRRASAPFAAAREQLGEYFAGARTEFELALAPGGTPFQRRVWEALERIPFGETTSYAELARRIGHPAAARAVGAANGANPIAIVVPCHRVIAADGSLSGYAGGVERKSFLLELEAERAA